MTEKIGRVRANVEQMPIYVRRETHARIKARTHKEGRKMWHWVDNVLNDVLDGHLVPIERAKTTT